VTTANSSAVARRLVAAGAALPARVRVIPNGLDLDAVSPRLRDRRAAQRRAMGAAEDEFLWVAAGNLREPKDYPNLLAALARRTGWPARLRVAIAGEGPLLASLQAQTTALGLGSVVTFLGPREDVPACMAAADATVLPSAWEGLPNAVIESLAVGTPAVCTSVGGVTEIVADGVSGLLVPPRDAAALASAMAAMMTRPAGDRLAMGATGRAHVERHFGLETAISAWQALFDELLAARGGATAAAPQAI
jgi:glycosyltransferase involved in cell wall biosynthesis